MGCCCKLLLGRLKLDRVKAAVPGGHWPLAGHLDHSTTLCQMGGKSLDLFTTSG